MDHEHQKLKEDSLGLGESVIMGVAGTAPAYSLSATTAVLMATVGLQSLASLLFCGLIMFGVSISFHHLNRLFPSAGGSYTWITEVFHPVLGFFSGWSLLVASAVFMVSGTIPAAIATLSLVSPESIDNPIIVSGVAIGWLLVISGVVTKGIKLSSYFQVFATVVEVLILILIILLSLIYYHSNPVHPFEWHQLSLSNFSFKSFFEGILVALYFYWGWDVTVNLSEETKQKNDNPGKGANWAMLIVLMLFMGFMLAVQFAFTEEEVQKAGTTLIFSLAEKIFPAPWSYIAVIAVMLSTIGTLETTILQFTRTMYAKGRDGILHVRYAHLHAAWKTPWKATLVIAAIGTLLLICSAFFSNVNAIIDLSVKAIGFQIAFYYGLTSFACAFRFRKKAFKTLSNFIFVFCWPIISGLFMILIFAICAITLDWKTTVFSIGSMALGVIPLIVNRLHSKHYN
jgi:amino acid transporter